VAQQQAEDWHGGLEQPEDQPHPEPSRVRGEREWRVEPLGLPPGDGDPAESPAVRLFVDRARDVQPGFELTSGDTAAIVEVCRRLDGLPLALELAATWLRLLTPQQLLQQLTEHMERRGALIDLPDRQQTMTATVGWSYQQLPEPARQLLARLTVFAGLPQLVPSAWRPGP